MYSIIPEPLCINYSGEIFKKPYFVKIVDNTNCPNLDNFLLAISKSFICLSEESTFVIELTFDSKCKNKEGYSINCSKDGMIVTAATSVGIFYALKTVEQLLLSSKMYECKIVDEPLYEYRGFMLDVGRYFYTVKNVKEMIDWCAIHKLNYFHLHLTEDQGWRIQIDKYPLLTSIGSSRTHTNFDTLPHSGFYTKEDIKDIVSYAKDNYITVIPEIDMPGHMRSAIASYSHLSCFDRKLPVATHWGVKYDILCAGKDSTYEFCFDVLNEIVEMFDSPYIHIGGDEAPKLRWSLCPHCKEKMLQENLASEDALQDYFTAKMSDALKEKGRKTIVWYDKTSENSINDKVIAQYWGGAKADDNLNKKVNNGLKIINSNSSAYYIDLPYGRVPLYNTYNSDPTIGLDNPTNIIGLEATLWTEYVPDMIKAKKMTFPRLGAFAEICWTPIENRDYHRFLEKISDYKKFISQYGIEMIDEKVYNPNKIRGFFQKLWFERRQLTWEGLHNIIDNAKVKREASKK